MPTEGCPPFSSLLTQVLFDTPILLIDIFFLIVVVRLLFARIVRLKRGLKAANEQLAQEHQDKLSLLKYAGIEFD